MAGLTDARDMPRGILPVDRLFLAYILFDTLVLASRAGRVASLPLLLFANALAALLPALLARAGRSAFVAFVGGAYPLILAGAFYTQLGVVATDVGVLHDPAIQRLEDAIFGAQLSLTWHARMPAAALSWILHACYGAYYALMLTAPLYLVVRRSWGAFERSVFMITLGLYACYVVFALYPVAGPRYFWGQATGSAAQVLPARLMGQLLEGGSALGTAFPSSHVAATWCAVYSLWRDARWLALLLAPVAVGLALGTVYGQFHYAVDSLAGGATAIALCALADPLSRACTGNFRSP